MYFEDFDTTDQQERNGDGVFSKPIRAGKRTYFFDVKSTRSDELYLTITESKRRYDQESDKFFYEKHKLFLYKEDFDKFSKSLDGIINYIRTGEIPIDDEPEDEQIKTSDFNFESLNDDSFKYKKLFFYSAMFLAEFI